jgi:site-specific recombinase XerD
MTELATVVTGANIQPIINLVCNAVTSPHTKRAYQRALADFMVWYRLDTNRTGFSKATVQAHVTALREAGVSASSINQRITAIRKLAVELADNGIVSESVAQAIGRVEGVRKEGQRLGNWLTKEQAQTLLGLPNVQTVKGLRDRAILAILLGCGLRREECVSLRVDHIQMREARWVIVDLVGKRSKTRSVPMPSWAKYAVDSYLLAAGIADGVLFRSMRRGDNIQSEGMTAQAVFNVVKEYAAQIGIKELAPHDLRRSFAKLAHKGNSPLEQIQLSLGHSSVQTTERYIGVTQDLSSAPCDALGLRL